MSIEHEKVECVLEGIWDRVVFLIRACTVSAFALVAKASASNYKVICSFAQEIIQNADDAGAKTVKFFIDNRKHGTMLLVHPDLAPFQGPALLAYNDAQFRDEDWKGIQNLQRSVKAKDPFKVGKFGIGFNSVYHITGSHLL